MNDELQIGGRNKKKVINLQHSAFNIPHSPGFGLIEILITSAMVSLILVAFGQVAQVSLKLLAKEREVLEASFIAEEAFEGVRALRDQSWSANIAGRTTDTNYYLTATSTWDLSAIAPSYIQGKYLRAIVFSPVLRDASDQISNSGANDAGTRKVMVTVSWWSRNATSSVSASGYLADIHQN